jgi:DNA-binding SARP family transcriptional activator
LPSETGLELAVRALGPLSVEIEGRPVPDSAWGSRKSIVLLVFLADAGGRATSADRLGEALWPDALEGARAVLQTTVSRVRKAFRAVDPALPDPVAHDRTGYRIPEAYAIDSDVRRFEGLCKAEDEASLQEALALYRGPFLEGLSDDWVESRRRSLDGLFFEAMDRLATVLEETDRATEAVRLYERVLEREPCREQSQVGLLRALARSGRRDEAVRRYHDCVRALKKILGVGPGPALVATYHELRG